MSVFSNQSISYEYIKVRWQEPYVSEAVNKRLWGTLPKGIYSGFAITAGPGVRGLTVGPGSVSGGYNAGTGLTGPGFVSGNFDETVGWSIAIHYNDVGHSSAVVITPGIHESYVLSATGLDGQRVYAALDVQYAVNAHSAAQIKLVNGAELNANPSLIVIGYCDVPANPITPIDNSMIGYNDPYFPRVTPLATAQKPGLMPTSAWTKIEAVFAWTDVLYPERDPNNFYVLQIKPSQKVVTNRRIYSHIRANVSSRFPRNASEQYNGGPTDSDLTKINFQTGIISGAHQIPTNLTVTLPSIIGTPFRWQVGVISLDNDDRIQIAYGSSHLLRANAVLDANLPTAGNQVCALVFSTDASGVLNPLGIEDVLDRRTFLNLGAPAATGIDVQEGGVLVTPEAYTMNFIGASVETQAVGVAKVIIDLSNIVLTVEGGVVYDNNGDLVSLVT